MRKIKIWNNAKTQSLDLNSNDYLATNISGFGNSFKINKISKTVIKNELEFESLSILINFGVNGNAYNSYKTFANFIYANGRNKLIVEYDYNGASRFCDVYIKNMPKSQKTNFNIISETFVFERTTPWYEKVIIPFPSNYENYRVEIINNSLLDYDLKLIVESKMDTEPTQYTLFQNDQEIQKITVFPENTDRITIDGENKKIYYPNGRNAYEAISKNHNTFMYIPANSVCVFYNVMEDVGKIEYKKWVAD